MRTQTQHWGVSRDLISALDGRADSPQCTDKRTDGQTDDADVIPMCQSAFAGDTLTKTTGKLKEMLGLWRRGMEEPLCKLLTTE